MIIRRIKYRLFALLAVLLMLTVCGCQEEDGTTFVPGEGRLLIGGLCVETGVNDIPTRSTQLTAPADSYFTLTLTNKDDDTDVRTLEAGATEVYVPAGSYTLSASYGGDSCSTVPYYYGETDVTISAGATSQASLSAKLQSAIIHPAIADNLIAQFSSYTISVACADSTHNIANDEDYFVPAGGSYSLSISGTNMIGEQKTLEVYTIASPIAATRYTINCNPTLPSFTMPEQAETNAWSKFINITPMTASNMTSKTDMAEKVMANIVYEASADGVSNWIASTKDNNGNYSISGLQPATTYYIRSRFGGVVSSNTVTLTTENGTALTNGNMEEWSSATKYSGNGTYSTKIVLYTCTGWATRNEKTIDGCTNANSNPFSNSNFATYWRWWDGTVSSSESKDGSNSAEISTLAFYNSKVSGSWSRSKILSSVASNGTAYAGYLFLGTYDLSSDSYTLGISHDARPVKLSFDYKYVPCSNDSFTISAAVYDSDKNVIATLSNAEYADSSWETAEVGFDYTSLSTKAAYIHVFFQSGTNTDISTFQNINGSYSTTPYVYDRIVGSQLYVDNVTLVYE
jgi:hypothetical protein